MYCATGNISGDFGLPVFYRRHINFNFTYLLHYVLPPLAQIEDVPVVKLLDVCLTHTHSQLST